MRTPTLFISTVVCFSVSLLAQPPEPKYVDQFNAVIAGQAVPLERQTAVLDTKSRRNFVVTPNTKLFENINGQTSPVRVPSSVHFVVRMSTAGRDPQTLIHLKKLVVAKTGRQILIETFKQSLIPFAGGVKHERAPDESIAVDIKPYGSNGLEITPHDPLPPGEYAFMSGHDAQCFGIDAGDSNAAAKPAAENTAQPAAPAPAPAPVPQHIAAHPASTFVDLPPAAPGFPPLHASAPAPEGCWWVPFVSPQLSLEMLVLNCDQGHWMGGTPAHFIAGAQSVSVVLQGSNDATELFTVCHKPAAQTITAAIQQQFINKLPVAAARTRCKPVRDTPPPHGESYHIEATGPYSKLKKFASTDDGPADEDPCPGLQSDDVTGRSFLYIPEDSKNEFIFFHIQELWPFDQNSIRLHRSE